MKTQAIEGVTDADEITMQYGRAEAPDGSRPMVAVAIIPLADGSGHVERFRIKLARLVNDGDITQAERDELVRVNRKIARALRTKAALDPGVAQVRATED